MKNDGGMLAVTDNGAPFLATVRLARIISLQQTSDGGRGHASLNRTIRKRVGERAEHVKAKPSVPQLFSESNR